MAVIGHDHRGEMMMAKLLLARIETIPKAVVTGRVGHRDRETPIIGIETMRVEDEGRTIGEGRGQAVGTSRGMTAFQIEESLIAVRAGGDKMTAKGMLILEETTQLMTAKRVGMIAKVPKRTELISKLRGRKILEMSAVVYNAIIVIEESWRSQLRKKMVSKPD